MFLKDERQATETTRGLFSLKYLAPPTMGLSSPVSKEGTLEPKASLHLSLLVPDPPASSESCSCCQGVVRKGT